MMLPQADSTPEQLGSKMNDEQRMQSQQQTSTTSQNIERVVIHHLSDLRYRDDSKQRETLFRYRRYLDTLAKDGMPNVVVITGDLTDSGEQHDLRAVANFLAACFPDWEHELDKHIFVLPGVRDVNWESVAGIGWQTFVESFKEFARPSYGPTNAGDTSCGLIDEKCSVYPICTCYQPNELSARLKTEIETYEATFTAFTRMRDQLAPTKHKPRWPFTFGRKPKKDTEAPREASKEEPKQVSPKTQHDLKDARNKFLQITEDYQPLALASGRVLRQDLKQLDSWSTKLANETTKDPLKILITHHPLAIDMDQPHQRAQTRPEEQSFKDLAQKATQAGFDLALHGHAHQHAHSTKALSGFSILGGEAGHHPLRQIGAASLCDTGTFNEIIAERRTRIIDTPSNQQTEQIQNAQTPNGQTQMPQSQNGPSQNGQGQSGNAQNGQPQNDQQTNPPQVEQVAPGDWRFELRLINVDVKNDNKTPFLLLNPDESAEHRRKQLESAAERRQKFESRLQIAMGQFSERVQQSFLEKQLDRPNAAYLPQSAMQVIEAIIRDIIFSGCAVRVRVLLKDDTGHRPFPKLTAAYLTPPIFEGPDTLVYPASVAAWCLVLGRTLRYPEIINKDSNNQIWRTSGDDHEWLRATNKLTPVRQALEALNQELFARSVPNEQMQEQYKNLISAVKQLESGSKTAYINGTDIYQTSLDSGLTHSYTSFICVPYPRRPRGGALPTLPETMVLDVGVRPIVDGKASAEEIFTDEHIEMLESIAELIGLMLTTANALGKPRGLWDARVRG